MTLGRSDLESLRDVVYAQISYLSKLDLHDTQLRRHKEIRINQLGALHQKLINILGKEYNEV